MRAEMSPQKLGNYLASLVLAQLEHAETPSVVAYHALESERAETIVVGRSGQAAFSSLLERGPRSLTSRSHFTVATGGLRNATLRIHASNGTSLTRMN
jgi:hypothetical protein